MATKYNTRSPNQSTQNHSTGTNRNTRGQFSSNQSSNTSSQATQGSRSSSRGQSHGQDGAFHVSPANLEHYLKGIHFPCDKGQLLDQAEQNSAPSEVLDLLDNFNDQEFNSVIDVSKEVGRLEGSNRSSSRSNDGRSSNGQNASSRSNDGRSHNSQSNEQNYSSRSHDGRSNNGRSNDQGNASNSRSSNSRDEDHNRSSNASSQRNTTSSRTQGNGTSSRNKTSGTSGRQSQSGNFHVSPATLEHFLKGIHFPCSKEDLIRQAESNNASQEALNLLDNFNDQQFNSVIEVSKELGRLEG